MIESVIPVVNKLGLHARAASKLVKLCAGFASEIKISAGGQQVDGKSIMGILMLAATQGTDLLLQVDGEDEEAAVDAIRTMFSDCFGEGE
ncbi:MAG: HPr family phosphocarrier protein [Gammaproteobacteria bacterium]|nr:HPr family phosphocarrier protein [Gammaproteobacteria bacterium]